MGANYDRRVSDDFLELFLSEAGGGVLASLITYAKGARYPLDLHLRREDESGLEHATLYVGLTAVLNVRRSKKGMLRLDTHPTHRKNGRFDDAWSDPRSVEALSDVWADVELYLDRVIPEATKSHGIKEGAVQAALSSVNGSGLAVLDREVTPSFASKAEKVAFMEDCQRSILNAIEAAGLDFSGKPTKLGNECDAIAIDHAGRFLAVEVKPARAGSVAWVAAQAAMYARILQRWIDEAPSNSASNPGDVIRGLARQRHRLGLLDTQPTIAEPLRVVPVVALQRGASAEMVRRMRAVRDALDAADLGLPDIEIFEVDLLGRLLPLAESREPDGGPRLRYAEAENRRQRVWKATTAVLPEEARRPGSVKSRGGDPVAVDYALPSDLADHNLLPEVRQAAVRLFGDLGIPWHQGSAKGPSPHLRSSQVQCVNALGQMVSDPDRIREAFSGVLDVATVRDFGQIDPSEAGRHLTFEYIGPAGSDYFSEGRGGVRTRGSQSTSIDAAFAYTTASGVDELALVEWKYTETYPGRGHRAEAKLAERSGRYGAALAAPDSPVRVPADVPMGDLFHEPIYQLVRQQLLAHALEQDPDVKADVVRIVHVLSPANTAYQQSYLAQSLRTRGTTVDEVWARLLLDPTRFFKLDPAVFLNAEITSATYVERYGGTA